MSGDAVGSWWCPRARASAHPAGRVSTPSDPSIRRRGGRVRCFTKLVSQCLPKSQQSHKHCPARCHQHAHTLNQSTSKSPGHIVPLPTHIRPLYIHTVPLLTHITPRWAGAAGAQRHPGARAVAARPRGPSRSAACRRVHTPVGRRAHAEAIRQGACAHLHSLDTHPALAVE